MGIYATFSSAGFPTAFYSDEVTDFVPTSAVALTDAQWQELLRYPGQRKWNGSGIVALPPTPAPPDVVRTSAVEFWRRCSDPETEIVEAGIEQLPARKRRMVNAASEFWSTDEYYGELKQFLIAAFGASRASELLAASA
jgi:hypothetical protein